MITLIYIRPHRRRFIRPTRTWMVQTCSPCCASVYRTPCKTCFLGAHPSPQPKRHLDLFRHFYTAHGRVSLGMTGRVLSPKISPFPFTLGNWTSYMLRLAHRALTACRSVYPLCKAHDRVLSGMVGYVLSPKHCPFA